MGRADFYKHGDWNAICDRCGFKYKASELKDEYTGLKVCKRCWDYRHPQERMRARPDDPSVPWTRPDREPLDNELIGDPGFNDASYWTLGTNVSVSGGKLILATTTGTQSCDTPVLPLVVGERYKTRIDVVAIDDDFQIEGIGALNFVVDSTGEHTFESTYEGGAGIIQIRGRRGGLGSGVNATIENFSVRRIMGSEIYIPLPSSTVPVGTFD